MMILTRMPFLKIYCTLVIISPHKERNLYGGGDGERINGLSFGKFPSSGGEGPIFFFL